MKIAVIFTHTRRSGQNYYVRAARRLGHDVVSIGPWVAGDYGVHGQEPNIELPDRYPRHYRWDEVAPELGGWRPDVVILYEGGDDIRMADVPVPWAHHTTEGTNLEWSDTPFKYFEIPGNVKRPVAGARYLPKAFDHVEHRTQLGPRCFDLVQLASARDARRYVWDYVRRHAPDLATKFGDIWGPEYGDAYRNALATWVCSGVDFVTTRVFEAMASGCIVFSDRTPSMLSLFQDGVHFIGYDPVPGPGGEGMPDPEWLIAQVRQLRREDPAEMRRAAWDEVQAKHGYEHRVREILKDMGHE